MGRTGSAMLYSVNLWFPGIFFMFFRQVLKDVYVRCLKNINVLAVSTESSLIIVLIQKNFRRKNKLTLIFTLSDFLMLRLAQELPVTFTSQSRLSIFGKMSSRTSSFLEFSSLEFFLHRADWLQKLWNFVPPQYKIRTLLSFTQIKSKLRHRVRWKKCYRNPVEFAENQNIRRVF